VCLLCAVESLDEGSALVRYPMLSALRSLVNSGEMADVEFKVGKEGKAFKVRVCVCVLCTGSLCVCMCVCGVCA